ncbi:MAG: ABC transporter ATP-binding protein [Tissierellaceae bacterium]
MKRSIKKGIPFLIISLIILFFVYGLDGYINIEIMKIVDYALEGNVDLMKKEVLTTFILLIISFPLNIMSSYTRAIYLNKSLVKSKMHYIRRLFKKNINEFQAENNAKYLSAISNDMNSIEERYLTGIYESGSSIISFIVSFIVIASVSPTALFIGIGISFISAALSAIIGRPLQKHERHRSDLFEDYTSYVKEALGAFQIIKGNNLNEKVKEDFGDRSKDIQYKGYIIDKIFTYVSALQQFIMMGALLSIFMVSVYMAIKGSITAGAVILIVNNLERLMMPLMNLSEWFPKILSVKSLFIKMDESLENQHNYRETVEITGFNRKIEFRAVSFAYDENSVLEDIDLNIKKGGKYLIIGPSGSGKSTLLKLLRKYFNPTKGKIFIDGEDLKAITKESYFNNISNVEQQVFLFEDSLRNNITLYKSYSQFDIDLAIKRAGLSDFVRGLQDGLDTIIYDNGKNVSGGEKSRIAIARGLLNKSTIIFLDEAFANLDQEVAREIEETILDLDDVTVVNVSHVIFKESKNKYSKIFTVKGGRVIEN